MWVGTCSRETNSSPTTFDHVCSLAYGPGLDQRDCPPQPFSHPTCSRIGRSAALLYSRLPMILSEEAVMHIRAGIEVSLTLVVASGAEEELAPVACDPLPCHQAEPHPFGSTTGTILRSFSLIRSSLILCAEIKQEFGCSGRLSHQLLLLSHSY